MKKAMVYLIISLIISFLPTTNLFSQTRFIQGQVTVFDSIPVVHASVVINSTKLTYLTDSLGYFLASYNEKDKIIVTAHGFKNFKAKLKPNVQRLAINMELKSGEDNLEMAFEQGHILDRDKLLVASAIDRMSSKKYDPEEGFDYSKFRTLEEAIMARFTSVRVVNGEVIVRGLETWALTNAALVVVDGVVRGYSIANIPPETVHSIEILKGTDAVLYGSRGANGVVLIRTKRGGE